LTARLAGSTIADPPSVFVDAATASCFTEPNSVSCFADADPVSRFAFDLADTASGFAVALQKYPPHSEHCEALAPQ